MTIPTYGVDIYFIDNSGEMVDGCREQGPVADLSDGLGANSIETMARHCEKMAKKLRQYARENNLK